MHGVRVMYREVGVGKMEEGGPMTSHIWASHKEKPPPPPPQSAPDNSVAVVRDGD